MVEVCDYVPDEVMVMLLGFALYIYTYMQLLPRICPFPIVETEYSRFKTPLQVEQQDTAIGGHPRLDVSFRPITPVNWLGVTAVCSENQPIIIHKEPPVFLWPLVLPLAWP